MLEVLIAFKTKQQQAGPKHEQRERCNRHMRCEPLAFHQPDQVGADETTCIPNRIDERDSTSCGRTR